MDDTRQERREARKANRSKMRVSGGSVKTLHRIIREKADKVRDKERKSNA